MLHKGFKKVFKFKKPSFKTTKMIWASRRNLQQNLCRVQTKRSVKLGSWRNIMIYKSYWLEILSMKCISFNKTQTTNKFVQE